MMGDEGKEEIVESIHKRLISLANETRSGIIPIEKYIINKNLTKNVEEYNDAKVQPHVQVALQMKSRGMNVNVGDIIPYVICASDQNSNIAAKAHHPDEVRKGSLIIDYEWYLVQQIHPPLSRLCQYIEGTDSGRIADCLGLDSSKFATKYEENSVKIFSKLSEDEKYANVTKWSPVCPSCQEKNVFESVRSKGEGIFQSGFFCPKCDSLIPLSYLSVQLMNDIRKEVETFYECYLKCDEKTCGNLTKRMSVYEHRCINLGCTGSMACEFSNKNFYHQLDYFAYIFDCAKQRKKYSNQENAAALIDVYQENFKELFRISQKTLSRCSYPVIDLKTIFCNQ